jgi:ribosomal RNA-processing protein 12
MFTFSFKDYNLKLLSNTASTLQHASQLLKQRIKRSINQCKSKTKKKTQSCSWKNILIFYLLKKALFDYQPSENDPQQMIGWLSVMESAIRSLNRLNKELCLTHLPHFFQVYMESLSTSHHKNVHIIITNCLSSILEQCVQTNMSLFIDDLKQSVDTKKSLLAKIFSHIENGLSYQFHETWLFVMKVLACAFTSFKHRDTFVIVEKCLSSLGNLRESEQFTYKKEADFAIGRAIQTYGPKLMLDCIPIDITGDETSYDYPRSWMLPLLKDNIEKTELSYFIKTLLPLAIKLRTKSNEFLKNKQDIQHKIFDNLQNQVNRSLFEQVFLL